MNNSMKKTTNKYQLANLQHLMVRAEQAAAMCGVSTRQWHSMRASGQCPPSIKIGGCRLWRTDILQKWVSMDCPAISKFEKICKARGVDL